MWERHVTTENDAQLANFIWSICNLLRGAYKRNEYRKVILPLTVLRRFDSLLAPAKAHVLAKHANIKRSSAWGLSSPGFRATTGIGMRPNR
jgi:type I restriction enzyme M protein